MSSNRGVVYVGPGQVRVKDIPDPRFQAPDGRKIGHGVLLKVVTTNICGSDQHMVPGRTTAEPGLMLGYEITGEVSEEGADVEMLEICDIVPVPLGSAPPNREAGGTEPQVAQRVPQHAARFRHAPVSWKPCASGSRSSTKIVLCPVMRAHAPRLGRMPSKEPIVTVSSTQPSKTVPIRLSFRKCSPT